MVKATRSSTKEILWRGQPVGNLSQDGVGVEYIVFRQCWGLDPLVLKFMCLHEDEVRRGWVGKALALDEDVCISTKGGPINAIQSFSLEYSNFGRLQGLLSVSHAGKY